MTCQNMNQGRNLKYQPHERAREVEAIDWKIAPITWGLIRITATVDCCENVAAAYTETLPVLTGGKRNGYLFFLTSPVIGTKATGLICSR